MCQRLAQNMWSKHSKSLVVHPSYLDFEENLKHTYGKGRNWRLFKQNDADSWLNAFAEDARLVDNTPRDDKVLVTTVLWNSTLPHQNGDKLEYEGKVLDKRTDHFDETETDAWLAHLREKKYVVIENSSVTVAEYQRYIQLLTTAIDTINTVDSIETFDQITEHSLPPLKGKGLRGFYGLMHSEFSDTVRLMVKPLFETIYNTTELTCSLDALALSPPDKRSRTSRSKKRKREKVDWWPHMDQDEDERNAANDRTFSIQGTVCFATPKAHAGALPWKRIAQMVCWGPTVDRSRPGEEVYPAWEKIMELRRKRFCGTHWPTRGIQNWPAVPSFRPPPKPHLRVLPYDEGKDAYIEQLAPGITQAVRNTSQSKFFCIFSHCDLFYQFLNFEPIELFLTCKTFYRLLNSRKCTICAHGVKTTEHRIIFRSCNHCGYTGVRIPREKHIQIIKRNSAALYKTRAHPYMFFPKEQYVNALIKQT